MLDCSIFTSLALTGVDAAVDKVQEIIVSRSGVSEKLMVSKPIIETNGTFQNPWASWFQPTMWNVMKWRCSTVCKHPSPPTPETVRAVLPRVEELDEKLLRRYEAADGTQVPLDASLSATWCGHSSFLVQCGGLTFLFDPVFSERCSAVQFTGPKRMVPCPFTVESLPHIDVVFVSHNHYDHLDRNTIEKLVHRFGADLVFVVPLRMKEWFASLKPGLDKAIRKKKPNDPSAFLNLSNVVELGWWGQTDLNAFSPKKPSFVGAVEKDRDPFSSQWLPVCRVYGVPVQHWSFRSGFDKYKELWLGFVVEVLCPGNPYVVRRFIHCGDTGYCQAFKEIGRVFGNMLENGAATDGGFDFAMIPIGAYNPRWFMSPQHINPEEAVEIHIDLGSRCSIGMHWGTFLLTDEPVDEPPVALAAAIDLKKQNCEVKSFSVCAHGESRIIVA